MDPKTFQETIKFQDTTFFATKILCNPNLFGPNICLDPKLFGLKKMLDHQFYPYQIFGTKLCLDPKLFGLKKNVDQQFHLDQILGPNFFQTQVFSDQIFDLTKQNFCTQTKIF